jgi:2-polyprenyl-6-methoxyphenol hydroxylase-like FAD-dependent oxidoreductase
VRSEREPEAAMIDVVVVGGGPVGLWLAGELRLAGVGVVVIEQAFERSPHSRGLNTHARTIEVLDMRGMADAHTSEGRAVPTAHFAALSARLDMSVLNSRFPFMLVLPQVRTEERFAERAVGMGAELRLGHRVTGVDQDAAGAEVAVDAPDGAYGERARFVVGCDGARSTVRAAVGIEFDGHGATRTAAIGDVELSEPPERGAMSFHGPRGSLIVVPMPSGRYRLVVKDVERLNLPRSLEPTFEELRESTRRIIGTDLGAGNPTWLARVGNDARLARAYRRGRIFLAGDAAHIHPPQGGQGLNLGVQDAMNLGWKLAAEVNGAAPGWLLDSYERERRPVGASVIENSSAQEELASATTPPELAVRELLAEILADHPEVNRSLAERVSGLAVAYPAEEGSHPLAGHRAPDLQLDASGGAERLFELLRDGRFALISRRDAPPFGRIEHHALKRATLHGDEATGWTDAEAALVRPDGYFAWLGPGNHAGAACSRWIAGLPIPAERPLT